MIYKADLADVTRAIESLSTEVRDSLDMLRHRNSEFAKVLHAIRADPSAYQWHRAIDAVFVMAGEP